MTDATDPADALDELETVSDELTRRDEHELARAINAVGDALRPLVREGEDSGATGDEYRVAFDCLSERVAESRGDDADDIVAAAVEGLNDGDIEPTVDAIYRVERGVDTPADDPPLGGAIDRSGGEIVAVRDGVRYLTDPDALDGGACKYCGHDRVSRRGFVSETVTTNPARGVTETHDRTTSVDEARCANCDHYVAIDGRRVKPATADVDFINAEKFRSKPETLRGFLDEDIAEWKRRVDEIADGDDAIPRPAAEEIMPDFGMTEDFQQERFFADMFTTPGDQ